jgi:hypothetical protein
VVKAGRASGWQTKIWFQATNYCPTASVARQVILCAEARDIRWRREMETRDDGGNDSPKHLVREFLLAQSSIFRELKELKDRVRPDKPSTVSLDPEHVILS